MIDLPAVFERRPWGLVVVSGPDATSFLQAIVSQDLDPVPVGSTVRSLLLQPQGKLDVAFRATRLAGDGDGDEWWLDTEPDFGARLADGLARYRIRVKVDIADRTSETAMASVVGQEVWAVTVHTLAAIGTSWGGAPGVDLVGAAADVSAAVAGAGLRAGSAEELEELRIASGVPKLGVDVDDTTIPQEAFLEIDAVSFTKGCFIGQELVCRIDSRGHVNRFLRRLVIPTGEVPARGAEVVADGKTVGEITSAAAVSSGAEAVALAMVRREIDPPADVLVRVGDGEVPALVEA